MKQLQKITPYSDENLTWDDSTKKYYLTLEYCKANFDDNFADDEVLMKRIKMNTNLIYRFIKYRACSFNRRIIEKVVNYTQEGRDFLLEMLSAQMSADIETGYNDLSKTPAINVANGQVLDRNELYRNQLCVDAEQIFDSSDAWFGFRIGYQAPFPPIYFVMFK